MDNDFIKIATAFLEAVADEVDQDVTQKSIVKKTGDSEVTLYTADYLQFAKYGRGPGKQPPLDSILRFVKAKGIIFDGSDELGTAWAIAKSIAKKGTSNWTPNAGDALEEYIDNNMAEFYSSLSSDIVRVERQKLEDIYEELFPRNMDYKI